MEWVQKRKVQRKKAVGEDFYCRENAIRTHLCNFTSGYRVLVFLRAFGSVSDAEQQYRKKISNKFSSGQIAAVTHLMKIMSEFS